MNLAVDMVRPIAQGAAGVLDYGELSQPPFNVPHLMQHHASAAITLGIKRNPNRPRSDLLDFADAADEDLGRVADIDGFCIVHGSPTPMTILHFLNCIKLWAVHPTVDYNFVIFLPVSRENPQSILLLRLNDIYGVT